MNWHEQRVAGRVERHTEILREIAALISPDPERPDRPANAAEAHARLKAYLDALRADAPRHGLGAATGEFADHLADLFERYGMHLFFCFDDPRIPATTNELESFFNRAKRQLRHATGTGSTATSIAPNLGPAYLLAFAQSSSMNTASLTEAVISLGDDFPAAHRAARARLAEAEQPTTHRRSLVRRFPDHVQKLRAACGLAPKQS